MPPSPLPFARRPSAASWPLPPGWRTRFAPAPTGSLHLGHAANAVFVWGLAAAFGGRVVLRIEDHDRVRSRPELEAALLDDLEWLGFVPDEGKIGDLRRGPSSFRQSDGGARYAAALARLAGQGLVYACRCSRRTLAAKVGEAAPGDELCYPGTCREARVDPAATPLRRVRLPGDAVTFDDLRLGPRTQVPARQCGDLVVVDRQGHWTYQFAVVVDDMGWPAVPGEGGSPDAGAVPEIDVVIRGEDLVESTGRQILLARLLGRPVPPRFYHHPLLLRPDGAKLSKSNRDTGIRDLRAAGWSAERVLGEAARRAGLGVSTETLPANAVAELFAR
ncbi:MAG TPA: glutamate--tRNA ligase family protein [Thermoanaerobaculia bacterium]|nr:glutamate--tRNA ligase family protein [Thermoanaerobaculia bacterium]